MKLRSFAILLFCLCCAPVLAGPKEDALAAYQKFFAAFTNDNQDQIAALFASDALFYGTASAELVTTPSSVKRYFANALNSARGNVKATPFEQTALVLSDSVVLVSGKWQSERTLDGKMTTAGPSRITVVIEKRADQWLIVQFHNSPTPNRANDPNLK